MENITFGLELMVVGMSTVFAILLIVIWGGKLLIQAVNRVAPEEVVSAKKAAAAAGTASTSIDSTTMAILSQVVTQITGGKGKISSAKRM